MPVPGTPPAKVLICQLRQIGDVLLMTPMAELLTKHFPGVEIHVLTEKKCVPVLENNPYITHIWPIDKKQLSSLFTELPYYWKVARQGFDLVIDLQQTPRCRWVVGFSGAPMRLSRSGPWYTRWLYTHTIKQKNQYASAMKVALLQPLGITWNNEAPRIFLTETEKSDAASLLAGLGLTARQTLVTIDPTHRRITRRWPAAAYARLIDLAAAQNPQLRFLLLFGPGEEKDILQLASLCTHKDALLIPPEIISLRSMAACIARAALHCGNCSAPRHIAVAVGTPSLTLLGATSEGWTFPSPRHVHVSLDLLCQPCNRNSCSFGDCRCLTQLQPEQVLPHMLRMLADTSIRPHNGAPADNTA